MKGDIGGSEAVRGVVGRRGDGSGHEPGAGIWLPTPIEANNHVIINYIYLFSKKLCSYRNVQNTVGIAESILGVGYRAFALYPSPYIKND